MQAAFKEHNTVLMTKCAVLPIDLARTCILAKYETAELCFLPGTRTRLADILRVIMPTL